MEILEHLKASKTFKAFREIKRIMKSNGRLIISVPVFENYTVKYNPNKHMRSYTPALIKSELKLAGLSVLKEKHLYAFKNLYWIKDRIIRKIFKNKWKPNVIILLAKLS